jgi:polyhydroxybutyrate depolymerase
VILSLHGSRSTADGQARLSGFAQLAQKDAVVVFPEAMMPVGTGFEWDLDHDVDYLALLVHSLLGRYPVDAERVWLTGMSGGARMSCRFARMYPNLVGMVGAVGGLRSPGSGPLSRPVPILAFHGTSDRINPYGGSGTERWNESVTDAARDWASANGITSPPFESQITSTLTRTTYGEESKPGEVTLWTSRGAGHTWPGAKLGLVLGLFLGRTSKEINATDAIWEFGQRHASDP